ncbi:hypothetical protein Dimus_001913 [Dionaea muscipula]
MGRGRGKGKKQNARDDVESGEEEKIPASKRRGRPQRPLKNDEDGDTKMIDDDDDDDDDDENAKSSIINKDVMDQTARELDGKRRKKSLELKEDSDLAEDEKGSGAKSSTVTDDSVKSIGSRQNGSRRKGKPRRAAEVGVGCNFD